MVHTIFCQDSDAGLLFFEPALTTFAKSKIPSYSGFIPRAVLATVQAKSDAEGFYFMGTLKHPPIEIGQPFGRLTIRAFSHRDKRSETYWLCECVCGKFRTASTSNLRSNHCHSCGCYKVDVALAKIPAMCAANKTHGMHNSPEYWAWHALVQRCTNPKNPAWKNYGGRGIGVWPEWVGPGGFELFFAYVGPRPSPKHSIDRYPDNDGNYEPGNVRWATHAEQKRNMRKNRFIEYDNQRLTIAEWGRVRGLPVGVLGGRLNAGWSIERAMTTPLIKSCPSDNATTNGGS